MHLRIGASASSSTHAMFMLLQPIGLAEVTGRTASMSAQLRGDSLYCVSNFQPSIHFCRGLESQKSSGINIRLSAMNTPSMMTNFQRRKIHHYQSERGLEKNFRWRAWRSSGYRGWRTRLLWLVGLLEFSYLSPLHRRTRLPMWCFREQEFLTILDWRQRRWIG